MVYCEKCGTLNDDESFFCSSCGIDLPRSEIEPIVFGKVLSDEASSLIAPSFNPPLKPPMKPSPPLRPRFKFTKRASFRKRDRRFSPRKDEKAQAVLSLIFGLVIITVSLAIALPRSSELIVPLGFGLIALIFTYYRAILSSRDPVFFVAVATAIITMTLALTLAIDGPSRLILGIGFTLTALIYIFYRSRISSRDPMFFVTIGVAVHTLGLSVVLQSSSPLMFGIGFTLTALCFIYYRSRVSSRDPIFFVILAILVITFGFAFILKESVSIVFVTGFGLIGLTLIFNGIFRPILQSQSSSKAKNTKIKVT